MTSHRARRAGRGSLGLAAAGLAVCAGVLVLDYVLDPPQPQVSSAQALPEVVASAPARPLLGPVGPAIIPIPEPRRHQAAAPPRRVEVEALGIDVEVVPIELEASTLVPPDDPQVLGWWAEGAVPGARRGSALVTGHTVHAGGGALDHLETLKQGQSVTVTTEAGSIDYRVSRVEVFVKSRIAASAERLFSQRVRGRLVLVTCEDWNGVSYESNVVVIAHPV